MKKNNFLALIFIFLLAFSLEAVAQKSNKKVENKTENNSKTDKQTNSDLDQQGGNLNYDSSYDDSSRYGNYAILQALNKTTAKTSVLELKVGEKFSFGSIKIIPHKCWQSPLDQKPENKILLEIFEVKSESEDKIQEKRIFYGWMFSSSPSISGLEHPIYDIIAINCKYK